MKGYNINPFESLHKLSKSFGFTLLDVLVIVTIPYINIISSFFYLLSFKTEASSISKVCLYLTDLNKELYALSDSTLIKWKQSFLTKSLKLVIFAFCIKGIVLIFNIMAFLWALKNDIFSNVLMENDQKLLYPIAVVIHLYCCVYPSIAISADFVTCHILNEVGETFSLWNTLLKDIRYKGDRQLIRNGNKRDKKSHDGSSER